MADQVFTWLQSVLVNIMNWFGTIMERTGMSGYFVAFMLVSITVSILLAPILGARMGSSDRVKKKDQTSKEDK